MRLFAAGDSQLAFAHNVPAAPQAGSGLQVINLTRLFGSDETSARSDVMQQRMGAAEITLNPADAARFSLAAGSQVALSWQGGHWRLQLRLSTQLKPGLVGLPLGMAGLPTARSGAMISELQEAIA